MPETPNSGPTTVSSTEHKPITFDELESVTRPYRQAIDRAARLMGRELTLEERCTVLLCTRLEPKWLGR